MNPTQIAEKRNALIAEVRSIKDSATDGVLSPEALAKANELMDQVDKLEQDLAFATRFAAAEEASQRSMGRQGSNLELPHTDPNNTRNGEHRYSVLKAVRQSYQSRVGEGRLDGIEREVHEELVKRSHREVKGLMVPWSAPFFEARATTTSTGAGLIHGAQFSTGQSLIEALRAKLVVASLGATVLTDLDGLVAIPRVSTSTASYWLSEGGSPTISAPATDQVSFSPKAIGSTLDITRRLMIQSSHTADTVFMNDLVATIAAGVEAAALAGPSGGNGPVGILYATGVTSVALGADGAAPTYAMVVDLEASVANSNADFGSLAYVTNSKVRGKLKQTNIATGHPQMVWGTDPEFPVNNYRAAVTNFMPSDLDKGTADGTCSSMIFGNFNDLVLAFWGAGVELIINPYALSDSGGVRISALQDCDIQLRHPESFAKCVDILTS